MGWALVSVLLTGYIIGGLTFLPLLAWTLWTWRTTSTSHKQADGTPLPHEDAGLPGKGDDGEHNDWGAGLGDDLLKQLKGKQHVPDVASGYFAICREYVPGGINGKPPERTTPAGAVASMESPSVYQAMYRSIFDRNKTTTPSINASYTKSKKARNVFYVVLRLGHLMLYDDSEQLEVRHVISLAHYNVSIYAGGENIPEGELWIKRNCIRLAPRDTLDVGDSKSFYLFSDNCSEKEDFYHAMLRSQECHVGLSPSPPLPLKFSPTDLIKLVQQLHASEENLHTRWINALIGRLFLAMYKTKDIEDFIWTKITKKIARVQKPSLITSINVQKLDMGDLPPFLTNPKLKELTVDGDLTIEADVSYKGNFRIDISAVARIELGARFKPREVTLVLATILKALEGHILIRIKPPPSNRLWITFETPPKLELSLEPIVSSRQITYGVILRAIESRIREVVAETLVLPNWDDMPFSSTVSQEFRGGLWKEENVGTNASNAHSVVEDAPSPLDDMPVEAPPSPSGVYVSSSDAVQSMPELNQTHTLNRRKSAQTIPETNDESEGISSAVQNNPSSRVKPRALRASSYATAASPIINEESALFQGDERKGQDDAAVSMRTTVASSPPPSPAAPSIASSHRRRTSSTPTCNSETTATTQSFDDILASIPAHGNDQAKPPSRSSDPTTSHAQTPDRHASPTPSQNSDRKSALNQSLNSATAAAKKWLVSRQTQNTNNTPFSADAAPGKPGEPTTTGRDADAHPPPDSPHSHGHAHGSSHIEKGPIGRGQPLPPPGTPLPPPPRPDRKAWSVPAAAAFVNLAKRKPVATAGKGPTTATSMETIIAKERDDWRGEGHGREVGSEGKGAKGTPSHSPSPPPLPRRRQRSSVTEGGGRSTESGGKEEEMLVVEAPRWEGSSAPASPREEGKFILPEGEVDQGASGQSR